LLRVTESVRIVIIGGGVIGLGIAYHLAEMGVSDVLLIERNQLTSGTSWHAAGIVGPLRASLNLTHLASYATELFPALESKTGQSSGYQRTGGLWLARNEDRMTELHRIAHMGEVTGLHVDIIGPKQIGERVPGLNTAGIAGALWVDEDGQANPVDICAAYAKRARAAGIMIREGVSCAGFEIGKGAWLRSSSLQARRSVARRSSIAQAHGQEMSAGWRAFLFRCRRWNTCMW
jgi:glycine/D-amino acid oxidase-like deaminating enzyme